MQVFFPEAIAALIALAWNHTTVHAGGWDDLARGIVDGVIGSGVMLCSSVFGITASCQCIKHRRASGVHHRHATMALCLHGAVLVLGLAWAAVTL